MLRVDQLLVLFCTIFFCQDLFDVNEFIFCGKHRVSEYESIPARTIICDRVQEIVWMSVNLDLCMCVAIRSFHLILDLDV